MLDFYVKPHGKMSTIAAIEDVNDVKNSGRTPDSMVVYRLKHTGACSLGGLDRQGGAPAQLRNYALQSRRHMARF